MQSKAFPWWPGGPQTREHFKARAIGYLFGAAAALALGYVMLSSLVSELRNGSGPLLWVGAGLVAIASSLAALAVRDLRLGGKATTESAELTSPPVTRRAKGAQERKVVRGELAPDRPVDIKSLGSERELFLWVPNVGWDGEKLPLQAKFLNVGFTWNEEEAVWIRVTLDTPEYFDPTQVEAWSPPGGARELVVMTYELEIVAHLTVPGGYRSIHYSVKKDRAEPRVVVYLER